MKHLFFILLLSCCIGCWAAQEITIIPKPLRLTVEQGKFLLRPQTVISYEKELYPQAAYLQEVIGGSTGWDLKLQEGTAEGSVIHLETADKIRCAEGYELTVQPSGVRITGADAGGVFFHVGADEIAHAALVAALLRSLDEHRLDLLRELCEADQELVRDLHLFEVVDCETRLGKEEQVRVIEHFETHLIKGRIFVRGVPGLLVIRRPLLCQNADPDKPRLRHGLLVVTEFQG